jgi:hypothetical protein
VSDTIKLDYPIETEGRTVSEISLRRPTVGDMLNADRGKGSEADKEIRMFANLSELPLTAIESLDLADYRKLQETYQDFLS